MLEIFWFFFFPLQVYISGGAAEAEQAVQCVEALHTQHRISNLYL